MKKQNFSVYLLILTALFSVFASSCDEDDDLAQDNPVNGQTTAQFNPDITYGTLTDKEGNTYRTVTIGTQTWMAENLRTTIYNDGSSIPLVTNIDKWVGLTTAAYCNYNNSTNVDTIVTYGRLYNWHAINTGKLAPKGWHVPTNAEWTILVNYLGGDSVASSKLKETGTTHWNWTNNNVTNESGFTALPGGGRYTGGSFGNIGERGNWWSSTETKNDTASAWRRELHCYYNDVYNNYFGKYLGFSIRCVKD